MNFWWRTVRVQSREAFINMMTFDLAPWPLNSPPVLSVHWQVSERETCHMLHTYMMHGCTQTRLHFHRRNSLWCKIMESRQRGSGFEKSSSVGTKEPHCLSWHYLSPSGHNSNKTHWEYQCNISLTQTNKFPCQVYRKTCFDNKVKEKRKNNVHKNFWLQRWGNVL